jgi:hypothetical protein
MKPKSDPPVGLQGLRQDSPAPPGGEDQVRSANAGWRSPSSGAHRRPLPVMWDGGGTGDHCTLQEHPVLGFSAVSCILLPHCLICSHCVL